MTRNLLRVWVLLSPLGCGQPTDSTCPADEQGACSATALTYDTGIGELLSERCSPCHAADGVEAVRILTDYRHVFGQRTGIGTQLVACAMPPVGAPPLSSSERQQILDWLTCRAPQ